MSEAIQTETIVMGDQIAFWMFDLTFTKRNYFGTVLEVGETKIAGEPRTYLTVCEMPVKKILAHQVTRILKKRH